MTQYSSVGSPYWDDKPVVIVAGGKSLDRFDWDRLRPFHVLAVKATIFDIPWATAGFGLDVPRLQEWTEKMKSVTMPVYWAVPPEMMDDVPDLPCMRYLRRRSDRVGISESPDMIFAGATSGYGALQVPLLKRANVCVLLGYDYNGPYSVGVRPHLRSEQVRPFHHNEQHYQRKRKQFRQNWSAWAMHFNAFLIQNVRSRMRVINASPNSAITAFEKMTVDDALRHISRL